MKTETTVRSFSYQSVTLTDPNPDFTPEQVREFYATIYPEIISAAIEGPEPVGSKLVYTFARAVGTKGAGKDNLIDKLNDSTALATNTKALAKLHAATSGAHIITLSKSAQQFHNDLGSAIRLNVNNRWNRLPNPASLADSTTAAFIA